MSRKGEHAGTLADEGVNSLLLRVTCLFWLVAKLMGWRMFTTYRTFPTVAAFEWLNGTPSVIHTALFLITIFVVIALLLAGGNRHLLTVLLVAEVLLCLLDQNRWQPWEYQYVFIILIFRVNVHRPRLIHAAIAFLLAFTYIYSGLGKLNEGFLVTTWNNAILKHFLKVQASSTSGLYYAGYFLGVTELLAGAGLLFSKSRRASAVILIVMHLFILLFLGPFGLRFNIIVWPWNVAMILYLYLVFIRRANDVTRFKALFARWNLVVILCWAVLPAFNFMGYWDNYLSSNVYSGKIPKMIICVSDTSKCRPLRRFLYASSSAKICAGEMKINVQNWAMTETNVPVYPELRVYETIQKTLRKQYPLAGFSFVYY